MADAPLTTRAAFAPATFDAEAMTVELVWTTGARVRRVDPFAGQFDEELEVSTRAVDLSRLNAGAPLLDAHNQAVLDNLIGVVERAWITGNEGRATVRFSARAAAIAEDVRAGIIRNVSVGYVVSEWREIEAPRGGVPVRRAVRWQPHELSLVPVPADAAAQVRGAASPDAPAQHHHEVSDMPETTTRPSLAEFETIAASTRGILNAAWAAEQFRGGVSLDAARDAAIDAVAAAAAERGRAPAPSGLIVTNPGRSPADELAARADAIAARALGRAPSEQARQFMGARLVDHAREIVLASGLRLARYSSDDAAVRAALSNSDFPGLLNSAFDRTLQQMIAAETPARMLSRRREVADFRQIEVITFSGPGSLAVVVEGGEVTHAPPAERREVGRVRTWARQAAMTREMIQNDDLGAFATPARVFAAGIGETEGAEFASMFAANGGGWGRAMSDGQPQFVAAHGNVATGAMSTAGMSAARIVLRAQQLPGGGLARVTPRHVLVSPANETAAEQALNETAIATAEASRPVFAGRMQLHVEPRLSGSPWFMFADPTEAPMFEFVTLAGTGGNPIIETFNSGPDRLGLSIRAVHDFAIVPTGWVGGVRVTGS